jgi:hypothetical protein
VLSIAMPLLVVVWHLAALAGRPAHLDKIVAELGAYALGNFHEDPMPNHAGTRLLFIKNTENGFGLFFNKIGGRRKQIYEESYKKPGTLSETFLGWSPDDRFFAYGRRGHPWEIVIGDGDTGDALATVRVNSRAVSGDWLSPQTLVFAGDNQVLFAMENAQAKWLGPRPFKYFKDTSHKLPGGRIRNVTAMNADSVVWQQGNVLWSCGENSETPVKIWEATTNTLVEFSFSQAARRMLIHGQDASGRFFADFYPGQPDRPIAITRISAAEYQPDHVTLVNGGKGYAFMSQLNLTNILVIKSDQTHAPVKLRWPDQIAGFTAGQQEIFVTSSLSAGPVEIDRYDLASGATECAVPNAEEHFDYATNCVIARNQITNAAGDTLTYYLYAPPERAANQKHPLVIGILGVGQPGFAWGAYYEAFANCGNYYAYIERYHRESFLTEDVLSVYESLAQRPEIDTNNVYLYGVSVGAPAVYELLEGNPARWRGAVLFNPVGLPDPSRIAGTRLLIDTGDSDRVFGKEGSQVPMRFQDEAAKAGTTVTLLIHPSTGHVLRTPSGGRERLREALIFFDAQ